VEAATVAIDAQPLHLPHHLDLFLPYHRVLFSAWQAIAHSCPVYAMIDWPLGSMGLLSIHSITGGRWGIAVRPALALGVTTLPLMLTTAMLLLQDLRRILFFAVWLGLGALILRALRRAEPGVVLYRLAPVGLILLMPAMTFAGIDATMSRDPHFNSSILF
jgi:hypothetical protein